MGGRIIGFWRTKTMKDKLDITVTVWESLRVSQQQALKKLAEEYASFRQLCLRNFAMKEWDKPSR